MFNLAYNDIGRKYMRFRNILSDPEKLQHFLNNNRKDLFSWASLIVLIIIVYALFSEGDFSFLLTLSGIIQMFGFFIIASSVYSKRSVSGLSKNTIICYSVSFFCRSFSILFNEGYLPYDSSGDVIYRAVEVLAFAIACFMYYLIQKYNSTYNWDLDEIKAIFLMIPAFILGICIHPSLNASFWSDSAWTIALYLESISMIPQIYLFSKKGGEIESFTSHFVASQAFSRLFAFLFWICSYHELNEYTEDSWTMFPDYTGYVVMAFQIIQLVLLGDFMYYYIKSLRKGTPMILPSCIV